MSTIHKGLTVTVSVAEERLNEINALLEGFREKLNSEQELYREKMPSIFFISWLTLPAQWYAEKERLPARILLLTSYVGSRNAHIEEMAAFLSDQLIKVFGYSEEFPAGKIDHQALVGFLKRKIIRQTFYSGFKFIGTGDVPKEKHLKTAIFDYLTFQKQDPAFGQLSPQQIKKKIEAYVKSQPELNWTSQGNKGGKLNKIKMLLPLFVFGLVLLTSLVCLVLLIFLDALFLKIGAVIFPGFLLGLVLLFLWLRINENNPHIPNPPVPDDWIRKIVTREKHRVVNEMTVIAPLKKGLVRRIFLAASLRLISLVGYFAYIPTVHTARWLQMDRGKRLVFIANFDNISEAYAHDFVDSDNRSRNMAVIFSHAAGFPATKWLVKKGYNHRSEYMKGVRAHQKITQFWYAFNTELSVENLKSNRKFREGLFKEMEEEKIRQWLLNI
jgi:hypothetical protein